MFAACAALGYDAISVEFEDNILIHRDAMESLGCLIWTNLLTNSYEKIDLMM